MSAEQRCRELGIELPPPPPAAGHYEPYTRDGTLVIVSGQVPLGADGRMQYVGKLGASMDVETAYQSARLCALNCLAQVRAAAGSLDNVERVLRIGAFVNCTPDFTDLGAVTNGASDVILEILGEAGRHARCSLGMASLPAGIPTEVEMTVRLR